MEASHRRRRGLGGAVVDRPLERPHVRCLVARTLRDGSFSRTKLVTLAEAYVHMQCGWQVVGPDPDDIDALEEWERTQNPFGNRPRWQV